MLGGLTGYSGFRYRSSRFPRFAQSSGRFAQLHALSQFQNIQKKFKTKKQHSQAEIFPTLAYSNSASFSILFIFLINAMAKGIAAIALQTSATN